MPARTRPTYSERFTASDEQDLVRIRDNVIVTDVPSEDAAVREGDLEFG
jgi:hypothetical protein